MWFDLFSGYNTIILKNKNFVFKKKKKKEEDPLEKGMATFSSILAWKIPWTEEPGRLQSMGLKKSWT